MNRLDCPGRWEQFPAPEWENGAERPPTKRSRGGDVPRGALEFGAVAGPPRARAPKQAITQPALDDVAGEPAWAFGVDAKALRQVVNVDINSGNRAVRSAVP